MGGGGAEVRGKIQGGIWGQPWETKMEKEVEVIEKRDEGGGGGVRDGGREEEEERKALRAGPLDELLVWGL